MKKSRMFFRSFYLTLTVITCLTIAVWGVCKSYENTVKIGFGKTISAIGLTDSGIRILDFEIVLPFK